MDTGASASAVDENIIKALGIQPIGQCALATPSQSVGVASVYRVKVSFPQTTFGGAAEWSVIGCDLAPQGIIALVGRDILSQCILIFNGPARIFTLTF